MGWLRDAEYVAAVVVLEVLLEMELEIARRIGTARDPRQGCLPARGAKLLRCVLANLPAAVAPQHPRLEEGDAREPGIQETRTCQHMLVLDIFTSTHLRFILRATLRIAISAVIRAA